MTRKDIVTLPNPVLRQRSQRIAVIDETVKQLAQDMIEATLDWEKDHPNELGAALAAIQVGQPYRMVIIRTKYETDGSAHDNFQVYLNPEIVKGEGESTGDPEGCLSVPALYATLPRYAKVKVKALNLEGQALRITAKGFLARVFQHEIDHLQGKLFTDRIAKDDQYLKLARDGELVKPSATALVKAKRQMGI